MTVDSDGSENDRLAAGWAVDEYLKILCDRLCRQVEDLEAVSRFRNKELLEEELGDCAS